VLLIALESLTVDRHHDQQYANSATSSTEQRQSQQTGNLPSMMPCFANINSGHTKLSYR